ncbi:MAG: bifunctional riboflavin kinase/FAD synthetase [Deltaproteobacteria bacterium]|nr:bifunctional riboflavin kinase/FAD synthetase [Deltaproteobacteria bacterium]
MTTRDGHGAVIAIGNFDGLHRGHRALIARARALAAPRGATVGVVTFDPHPAKVLASHMAPPQILRRDEKETGLRALGVDEIHVVPFDLQLAVMAPERFVRELLVQRFDACSVVVGEGFRFGHKASGTLSDLRAVFGDDAVAVPVVKEGGLVCSSTKIRELVLGGNVEAAGVLLGAPYFLEGVVVRGDGRGRTIGIPTANLETGRELLPKVGVYATRAILDDGRVTGSVTNVGLRPTFAGEGVRIEAHLFDVDEDLYGRRLRLELVARLRDEQRFAGVDALIAQIRADADAARRALARTPTKPGMLST